MHIKIPRPMKINLTICGIRELPEQEGKGWTHVVSIWDASFLYDVACREQVKLIAPRAKLHFSFFEDVNDPTYPDAPRPTRPSLLSSRKTTRWERKSRFGRTSRRYWSMSERIRFFDRKRRRLNPGRLAFAWA